MLASVVQPSEHRDVSLCKPCDLPATSKSRRRVGGRDVKTIVHRVTLSAQRSLAHTARSNIGFCIPVTSGCFPIGGLAAVLPE
jgi:hypothetical protein